jgi:hypothetical protein
LIGGPSYAPVVRLKAKLVEKLAFEFRRLTAYAVHIAGKI